MTRALEAIVFDFDGVIVDSERLHLAAYQDVLRPRNLELDQQGYYAHYLGYDDLGVFRRYAHDRGLPWDDAEVKELCRAKAERFEELSSRGEMVFPGAAAFIRAAAATVPIAVASGALTHEIDEILEQTGLRSLFVAVVGADQCTRTKPSPDPYLEAVHRIHMSGAEVDPAQTVAIEDSVWGLVSARTAGLRTVAVSNTYSHNELTPHAELVVSGLEHLTIEALERLCATHAASVVSRAQGRHS
jgi:HAD superfamily hydrolase (TIGR01509 family)